MTDLRVNMAGIEFDNPITTASGTFGFGREYGEYFDLDELGAISVKGLTPTAREGNKPPRIAEVPAGILNSVGLQNPGVVAFCKGELPELKKRTKAKIMPAKVIAIEYDPNRTANIALLEYEDGVRTYIIAPLGLAVGQEVLSGEGADIKPGNTLMIKDIPLGTVIHNIELNPGAGAQLVRSAGNSAQLMAKEGDFAQVRLPSGEVRMIRMICRATIGQVGNIDHENVRVGKAGKTRYMGFRPTVRGSVMNPNDHPHGGGEGKSPVGRKSPMTPWGKPALGLKTRAKKNASDKYIVKRRNAK